MLCSTYKSARRARASVKSAFTSDYGKSPCVSPFDGHARWPRVLPASWSDPPKQLSSSSIRAIARLTAPSISWYAPRSLGMQAPRHSVTRHSPIVSNSMSSLGLTKGTHTRQRHAPTVEDVSVTKQLVYLLYTSPHNNKYKKKQKNLRMRISPAGTKPTYPTKTKKHTRPLSSYTIVI
jgi:hypothetical protein